MFVSRLGVNFNYVNMIDPFCENNDRTQRTYWTFVAYEASWGIQWRKVF